MTDKLLNLLSKKRADKMNKFIRLMNDEYEDMLILRQN